MKHYELTCLISSKLSEEEAKGISEKITSLIHGEEGILNEIKNLIKKRLGSPIKKEKWGYLAVLNFHFEADKLKSLEKNLKELPGILRFLITQKRVEKVKIPSEKTLPKIKIPLKRLPKEEEAKVEIADIEKKLEEILGEI